MKKITLILLAFVTAGLFSCKNSDSDPKSVLSQFFDAMSKKDIVAARKLATEESKSMLDLMEMGMKMDSSSNQTDKYDKSKVEFGEPKIEGDKAVIAVKEKKSGESMSFSLKKEKGGWKVAFDKASVIGIGMDKMKEKGINTADSISKAMKEINEIGVDSLKKNLEKSLKALDSVSKSLKNMDTQ